MSTKRVTKQITINGKKVWAELAPKLTPKEREEVRKRLLEDIKKIAEISMRRKASLDQRK